MYEPADKSCTEICPLSSEPAFTICPWLLKMVYFPSFKPTIEITSEAGFG